MSPYVVEKRRGGSDRDRRLRPKPLLKRTWPLTSNPAG